MGKSLKWERFQCTFLQGKNRLIGNIAEMENFRGFQDSIWLIVSVLKWGIICSIPSEKREWFNGAGNYVLNVVQSGIDANVSDDEKQC